MLNSPVWTKCSVKFFGRSKIRPVSCERGLSGRLQEVVPQEKETTGGLFREDVRTHLLCGR